MLGDVQRMGTLLVTALLALPASIASAQTATPALVLLLPVHTSGVDPVVARFVERGLRNGLESHGYTVEPAVAEPTSQAGTAVPADQDRAVPSLRELWNLVHRRNADFALLAQVSALHGKYVVEVSVTCRDGSGPLVGRTEAGNAELQAEARKLIESVMKDPNPSPNPNPIPSPNPIPNPNPSPNPIPSPNQIQTPTQTQTQTPTPIQTPDRFRLALHDEVVLGMDRDRFAGALLGARLDYLMGPSLYLGAYVGYANLPGYQGERAHSALGYVQLEHRNRIGERIGVPLRLGLGYLLRNGAVLRLSSGFSLQLTQRLQLVLDLIAPTFWVTPDTILFSLDLGVELGFVL